MRDPNLIFTLVFMGNALLFWLFLRASVAAVRGRRCPHCRLRLDRE
jgi:hypothetical protein